MGLECLELILQEHLLPPALIEHVLVPLLWDPLSGLLEAALIGSIKYVQLFLDLGAPINESPWILINAVKSGNLECLKLMLSKVKCIMPLDLFGVQCNVLSPLWQGTKTIYLKNAIDFAVCLGHLKMFKLFEANFPIAGSYPYYLEIATCREHIDMIKYLWTKMANYAQAWHSKMVAFAAAIWDKNYDLVDFFVQAGAVVPLEHYFKAYYSIANDSELFLRIKDTPGFDDSRLFWYIDPNNLKMVKLILKELKKFNKEYIVHVTTCATEHIDQATVLDLLVKLDFPKETIDEVRSVPYPHFLVTYPEW